jgi:hypothetical protein
MHGVFHPLAPGLRVSSARIRGVASVDTRLVPALNVAVVTMLLLLPLMLRVLAPVDILSPVAIIARQIRSALVSVLLPLLRCSAGCLRVLLRGLLLLLLVQLLLVMLSALPWLALIRAPLRRVGVLLLEIAALLMQVVLRIAELAPELGKVLTRLARRLLLLSLWMILVSKPLFHPPRPLPRLRLLRVALVQLVLLLVRA